MQEMKILVVYGTSEGQTAKVATVMTERFRASGHEPTLIDVKRLPIVFNVRDFDAAVVAARVHAGRYPRRIANFVRANRAALEAMPNAFVSVSMSAAKLVPGDEGRIAKYADDFIALSGWAPNRIFQVAGARFYTRHNRVTRWILGLVDQHRYDTSRDHEWTDWASVKRYADECIVAFGGFRPIPSAQPPADLATMP